MGPATSKRRTRDEPGTNRSSVSAQSRPAGRRQRLVPALPRAAGASTNPVGANGSSCSLRQEPGLAHFLAQRPTEMRQVLAIDNLRRAAARIENQPDATVAAAMGTESGDVGGALVASRGQKVARRQGVQRVWRILTKGINDPRAGRE